MIRGPIELPSARDLEIPLPRLLRLLEVPAGRGLEGRSLQVLAEARQWFMESATPRAWGVETVVAGVAGGAVILDQVRLQSSVLAERVERDRCSSGVTAGLTLGQAIDDKIEQSWTEGRPDLGLFLDALASAAVAESLRLVRQSIDADSRSRGHWASPHSSPGYPGWPLSDQATLYGLLRPVLSAEGDRGLQLLDSCMLSPKKSMLAWFPLAARAAETPRTPSPCDSCTPADCECRRVHQALATAQ